jgi:hypothetical protein
MSSSTPSQKASIEDMCLGEKLSILHNLAISYSCFGNGIPLEANEADGMMEKDIPSFLAQQKLYALTHCDGRFCSRNFGSHCTSLFSGEFPVSPRIITVTSAISAVCITKAPSEVSTYI